MNATITDFMIYRFRYIIGYLAIIFIVVGILTLSSLYVPGALRHGELDAALASGKLSVESIDPSSVIDLPYHFLQRVGFIVFGVTTLSIKFPSLVLGTLSVVGIFLLLRNWFRRNVAVLATVIAATTTHFLFLIQDGTPGIMFSAITIWLFLASTYISRDARFSTLWKVLCGALIAAALYTPLGIYPVIALIVTMAFHPHIRYTIRRIARFKLLIAVVLGLVSIIPLVYSIILHPSIGLTLLGIPTDTIHLKANAWLVTRDLFGFFIPSDTYILRPLYSLGVVLLVVIGIYKFLTVKYTARSYAVLVLSICVIPMIFLIPVHTSALFPIIVLMIAMGTATLIVDWYKLFPRNPYARVAGLIPLTVFVVGLVFSGVTRYLENYTYNPRVLSYYSNDLRLLDRTLGALHAHHNAVTLTTSRDEAGFYSLVARYDHRFDVTTAFPKSKAVVIMTHDAYHSLHPVGDFAQIITSRKALDADRFYIYKSPAN